LSNLWQLESKRFVVWIAAIQEQFWTFRIPFNQRLLEQFDAEKTWAL
jgi:hypothetical protein